MTGATRRDALAGLAALAAAPAVQAQAEPRADDLAYATAREIAAGIRARRWSAREVADFNLARIRRLNGPFERFDANGALNAFVRVTPERARGAAGRGPWAGVPVALKDVFAIAGLPLTVGSPALRTHRSEADCALLRRWERAGASLLGHTQAQRFVSGASTPQTANPWNPRLIAGGSSGGSAAAVAAGLVPVALGTETAGSLIHPALCCAVTTLKPSYGLLSTEGVFPGVPTFDVAGPLARTAADCAWAMATLAGQPLAWPGEGERVGGDRPLHGVRLLLSTNEPYSSEVDPRFRQGFDGFVRSLEAMGAAIVPADIPADLGRGPFQLEKRAELGGRSARQFLVDADLLTVTLPTLRRWLANASDEDWQVVTKRFGGEGRRLESDALSALRPLLTPERLAAARKVRDDLRAGWASLLARHRCDGWVYLEVGAPLPERRGLEDTPGPRARRTGLVPNDLGWPVISLPVATAPGLDVPISAQMMAPAFHDHRLLAWAMAWQARNPDIGRLRPPGLDG